MRKTLLWLMFLVLASGCAVLHAQTGGGGGSRNPFPQPGSFPTFLEATGPNVYTWATGTGTTAPGGTTGQLQYNNASAFGGFTLGGDCVITVPNIVCTKTNGVAFASSATTDTTNAANISSGTLATGRLPVIPITLGGTGQTTASAAFNALAPTTAAGGLIIGTGANTYGNLALGATGTCVQSNGTTLVFGACGGGSGTVTSVGLSLPSIFTVSGSPVTGSGILTGALASQTANQVFAGPSSGVAAAPTFRSIVAADLAGSPVTNDCLGYNGTSLTWLSCTGTGLPSTWTVGTNNLVTAAPTSGQDQTTLNITPSLASGGTFNIAQVAAMGTTPQVGCVNGVYWAVEFGGTMCMGGNGLQLGAILQQSTPSFIQLFGAPGAGAYQQISSAALPNAAQPVPTTATTGGSIAANTYNFKITYLAGPSQTYETAASTQGSVTTTGTTSTITVPAPANTPGETGCRFYEEDSSHGVWVIETTAVPCVSQTYSTLSYATAATPPTINNTGGIYQSYFGTATALSGAACVSATVPGPDCPAGSWIETNPMTAAGDVVYGGAVNVEGFATPTRLAIGSVGQCLGVATSTTLGWQSCGGSGSSAWSALTAPTANLTLAMGANSTAFNWTSGLQTSWDTSGNLELSTTQAASSGSNHASPNFILSPTYWNGTASASGLWTFGASVNSSNAAVLTLTPSNFGSDATGFAVNGHFVGNNTPMFTVNGDATGAVMDFEAAFSQLATIRASSPQKNLLLNAGGAGTLYLNYDSGSGGVNFANGASGVVGSVSSAGAATFNSLTLATTPLAVASGGTGQSSLAFQTSVTWVSAGTMTWTVGAGMVQNLGPITVTHATTSTLNLSGLVNGASYQIAFLQDATGGGTTTLNLGTGCTWMLAGSSDFASASSVTITPTASHGDVLAFTYDGTRCWATYK